MRPDSQAFSRSGFRKDTARDVLQIEPLNPVFHPVIARSSLFRITTKGGDFASPRAPFARFACVNGARALASLPACY